MVKFGNIICIELGGALRHLNGRLIAESKRVTLKRARILNAGGACRVDELAEALAGKWRIEGVEMWNACGGWRNSDVHVRRLHSTYETTTSFCVEPSCRAQNVDNF